MAVAAGIATVGTDVWERFAEQRALHTGATRTGNTVIEHVIDKAYIGTPNTVVYSA